MLKLALVVLPLLIQKPQTPARPEPSQPEGQRPATQLDEFLSKKGTLVIRDLFAADPVTAPGDGASYCFLSVTAVSAYEPGHESTKFKGVQCGIHKITASYTNAKMCSLDMDEAESVSGALQYLIDLADKWKGIELGKGELREAAFDTNADLRLNISISSVKEGVKFWASAGAIGAESIEFDSPEKMKNMKASVNKAIAWLKAH